jgi:hypothetical protein
MSSGSRQPLAASCGSRQPLAASSGSRQSLAPSSGTTYRPNNLLPRLEEKAVIGLTFYKGIVLKVLFACELRTLTHKFKR